MKCGPEELRRRIAVAAGGEPADLVIRNVTSFSLSSGELLAGDIAIVGDVIAGIGPGYRGERELDGAGSVVVPGFIDSHCHVESTLLTPFEFERLALAHGVTTAVCDPHELANVAGAAAVEWFLASAERLRMSLFVQIPSCVPATCLETSGAELSAEAIAKFRRAERSLGLAEMMNVPGVLGGDPGVLAKLALWAGANIDGHAPLLTGRPLDGVLAAGLRNCHECSRLEEAREKLARGMTVLIREGSAARNLEALAPLLTVANSPFLAFCCDDRNSLDWRREGGVDFMVRRALALGCEPLAVYRAASWSAARAFGLADRGLVAPGQRADLVLVDALESGSVRQVVCGGVPVSEELLAAAEPPPVPEAFAQHRPARTGDGKGFPDRFTESGNSGDRADRTADSYQASGLHAGNPFRRETCRSRARHPEGGGLRPARKEPQRRARICPGIRSPAGSARLQCRARQPQSLRGGDQ